MALGIVSATAEDVDIDRLCPPRPETAAKFRAGALYLSRYTDDDNVHGDCAVRLDLPKGGRYRCHLTDDWHVFTEVPLDVKEDGSCELTLVPSSFAFVESEE